MDRLRPFVLLLPLLAACGTPEPPAVEAEVLPDTTRTPADVEKLSARLPAPVARERPVLWIARLIVPAPVKNCKSAGVV